MPKAKSPKSPAPVEHNATPATHESEPHPQVSSPSVKQSIDRMKHVALPNDGEPLAHRNRGKAGRKG